MPACLMMLSVFKSRCTMLCLCSSWLQRGLLRCRWWCVSGCPLLPASLASSSFSALQTRACRRSTRGWVSLGLRFRRCRGIWWDLGCCIAASVWAMIRGVFVWSAWAVSLALRGLVFCRAVWEQKECLFGWQLCILCRSCLCPARWALCTRQCRVLLVWMHAAGSLCRRRWEALPIVWA